MRNSIFWVSVFCLFVCVSAVRADLYWDTNGAAAGGSAGTTAPGTWGIDNFWSTSSAGTAATGAWTAGETAVFSAGTNVTGTYDVTLDSTQVASGLRFEEGDVNITGGTELTLLGATADFNGSGIVDSGDYVIWRKYSGATGTGTPQTGDANGDTNVDNLDYNIWRSTFGNGGGVINVSSANATITSTIGGTGGLTKTGAGTLNLNGANTYTGGTAISGGKLVIPNDGALGTIPAASTNHIRISNGGILSSTEGGVAFMIANTRGIAFGAGGGAIDIADAGAALGINAPISGADKWTKSGPGQLTLANSSNTFTGGFKVTNGILVHSAFESSAPAPGTLRSTGAEPAAVVPDYAIMDGGAMKNSNVGVGSTFLSTRKGISLGANGGTIIHDENATFNQITIYFGKISLLSGVTEATLIKRGKGEFRSDKATKTDDDGWDQTKLIVEEGLFRIGHFSEETVLGKVPLVYKADAVVLNGQGTTRATGAAAIGLTSFDNTDPVNEHHVITTTPATRGITLGANGGTICTSIGIGSWVFESIITGPGGININGNGFPVSAPSAFGTNSASIVFKGANTYLGTTNVNAGFLVVDGATAKLGAGDVFVDGLTPDIDDGTAVRQAAGNLRILAGVANAIANTATLNLTGGGTAGTADVGSIELGTGINETINKLMLTITGTPTSVGPGVFGSTASGAANPGLAGLGVNPDEYFSGLGTLTVLSAGSGSGLNGGAVPEPTSAFLFVMGLGAFAIGRRRR